MAAAREEALAVFVRTDRLLLRPGWPDDAPALAAAIGEERIVRNLARAPWPYELRDAERFLTGADAALPNFLIFARSSRPPELVGGIGFGETPHGEVELGYWIAFPHWNRGFVTEAGHATLRLARHGLRLQRVLAGHFADNPASGRVLRKLGFEATGDDGARHSRTRGGAAAFRSYALNLHAASTSRKECVAA